MAGPATNHIPSKGRVLWFGTAALIPAGWSRDTNFDDRFIQGSTTAGSTGGGTHTHTQLHSHSGNYHSHTFTGASATASSWAVDRYGSARPQPTHSHQSATTATEEVTYQTDATTSEAGTATPPYTTAIIIKPDDTSQDVPDDAVCFTDESSAPTGFHITDGDGDTIDLDGQFILGADDGEDGGDTGGSATHTHTIATHSHTPNTHDHDDTEGGNSTPSSNTPAVAGGTIWNLAHHWVNISADVIDTPSSVAMTIDNATYEPAYTKLLGIQNTSGGATTPLNVVILFDGADSEVPSNWTELNGDGGTTDMSASQVKVTTTTGEIGDTGGANNHTHTTTSHGHTHVDHFHTTGAGSGADNLTGSQSGGGIQVYVASIYGTHAHTWSDTSATSPSIANASPTMASSDGRYQYRTVRFIKKTSIALAVMNVMFYGANF